MIGNGYEPRWDVDYADGYQCELFTQWAMDAIREGASAEIKSDRASWRTGNVYVEFECQVSGQWVPSGIDERHTEAALWCHLVVGPMVLFAPTAFVRWVATKYGTELACMRGSHPTRGRVMSIPQFVAAVIALGRQWATGDVPEIPAPDPLAPFGRDRDGMILAPYGINKDGRVRLQPGGRR